MTQIDLAVIGGSGLYQMAEMTAMVQPDEFRSHPGPLLEQLEPRRDGNEGFQKLDVGSTSLEIRIFFRLHADSRQILESLLL